ncbi:polysaccharide pyruvyl transferase family protein [Megamonas hypermegale]|uniref:polysaccharide pyruvyl transferase family protein n=1 Tax=Megamonas hypermegale TaxID=158847 RepID=UPI0026F1B059|nr:polysaccharide pyruvyl transferase family protein [Megamonas hypermegale]
MKIGIITINDNNNYGNRLQNYALQEWLHCKLKIDEVNTIWYDPQYTYVSKFNLFTWKTWIKYILNLGGVRSYLKDCYYLDNIRMYNIGKFSRKIHTKFDLKILDKDYDYFIVGSDQVWNPKFWATEEYGQIRFLRFVPKEKRIAYAASIAIPSISKDKEQFFKDSLNEMKAISMREKAGAELVKKLTGRDVPVVVDPTILLSKEEWQKIELVPEWYYGEKYILTYFLGNPSPIIENLAKKNNWKIFNLMDKSNLDLYASRVEEFVYLIEHAELVATDSFHACVFSILMNTPFLVINRQQKGVADMTSRLDTLLDLFGYQNRYIIDGKCDLSDDEILYMDFSNVKAIQEREVARSTAYMKKALNIN